MSLVQNQKIGYRGSGGFQTQQGVFTVRQRELPIRQDSGLERINPMYAKPRNLLDILQVV